MIGIRQQFSHEGYLFFFNTWNICDCLSPIECKIALLWWNGTVDMLTKTKKTHTFLKLISQYLWNLSSFFFSCVYYMYIDISNICILYLQNITFYIFPDNCYFLIWIEQNQLTAFSWTSFLGCMAWFIVHVKRKAPHSKANKFIFTSWISYKVD